VGLFCLVVIYPIFLPATFDSVGSFSITILLSFFVYLFFSDQIIREATKKDEVFYRLRYGAVFFLLFVGSVLIYVDGNVVYISLACIYCVIWITRLLGSVRGED